MAHSVEALTLDPAAVARVGKDVLGAVLVPGDPAYEVSVLRGS